MPFEYLKPENIDEALSLLSKYGSKGKIIAGGTDLLVQIRGKSIKPDYVIDISYIPKLDCIIYNDKWNDSNDNY